MFCLKKLNAGLVRGCLSNSAYLNGISAVYAKNYYSTGTLNISHNSLGLHQIKIPLSDTTTAFNLNYDTTIENFAQEIQTEDPTVKEVIFKTADGNIISKQTPINLLWHSVFNLTINSKEFKVSPPLDSTKKEELKQKTLEFDTIKYSDFREIAHGYGFAGDEADEILNKWTLSNVVYFNKTNKDLSDTIITYPQKLVDSVLDSLDLKKFHQELNSKKKDLISVKIELDKLEKTREEVEILAAKSTNNFIWGGYSYLMLQTGFLARLVWCKLYFSFKFSAKGLTFFFKKIKGEYDWSVMESVTYFITLGTLIGGYLFYVVKRSEYNYDNLRDLIYHSRYQKILKDTNFDQNKFENLEFQLNQIQYEIEELRKKKFNQNDLNDIEKDFQKTLLENGNEDENEDQNEK